MRTAHGVYDHQTGQKCDNPSCRGPLKDTIINFGENLPECMTFNCWKKKTFIYFKLLFNQMS